MRSLPRSLSRSDPLVKRLIAASFPNYRGRKIKAVVTDDALALDLSWSGGTVDKVVLLTPNGSGTLVVPSPWARGANDPVAVPPGAILAVHSYFVGVDAGLTFYFNPAAALPLLKLSKGA